MILGTGFESRYAFRYALTGMILTLCLCDFSWAGCTTGSYSVTGANAYRCVFDRACQYGSPEPWQDKYPYCADNSIDCNISCCASTYNYYGTYYSGAYWPNEPGNCSRDGAYGTRTPQYYTCFYTTACTSQAEADSVACVNGGDTWANGSCQGPIDSTACDSYRSECESIGGKFTGNPVSSDVSSTGCLSFCDMCNSTAQNNYRRALANICCSQGKSPPSEITSCVNNELTGDPDMSFSNFDCDNQGGFDCDCQDVSSENSATYNSVCNEDQWEESNDSGDGSDSESSSSAEDSSNSSGSGEGEDWEYDYRDSLHKIIDYDKQTLETNKAILTCLTNPSFCGSNGSSPDYSGSLSDIKTDIKNLDTTVNRSITSIKGSISAGNDSLIDSIRKFISMNSFSFSGDTLGDSLGRIHSSITRTNSLLDSVNKSVRGVVNSFDSSIMTGFVNPDTGSGDYPWIGQGDAQRDSIIGESGFLGIDFGNDSVWRDSMEGLGYQCTGDSCCVGDLCEYYESDSLITDSLQRHAQRLGDSVRALNDAFYKDSVDDIFTEVKDSLRAFNPLHIFDSTLLSELGASIPNSNTCPEHCSTFQVDIPFFFGTQHAVIDWGLCMGRTAFANGNVLSFLRFIIRIIVAVTCITAVMWNATRIRR